MPDTIVEITLAINTLVLSLIAIISTGGKDNTTVVSLALMLLFCNSVALFRTRAARKLAQSEARGGVIVAQSMDENSTPRV